MSSRDRPGSRQKNVQGNPYAHRPTAGTAGNGVVTQDSFDPLTERLLNVCASNHSGLCDGDIANLSTGDDSCAAEVPPVRLLPQFARQSSELAPARGLPGNEAPQAALNFFT